jgi:hypothetical protein
MTDPERRLRVGVAVPALTAAAGATVQVGLAIEGEARPWSERCSRLGSRAYPG